MLGAIVEPIEPNRIIRYWLTRDGAPLSYANVLDLWQSDARFRDFFTQQLSDCPWNAYRWETPMLTIANSNQPFQFVLLDSPEFSSRETDSKTFADRFTNDNSEDGVVAFANLGGDATLVIPAPRTDDSAYGHLAAFVRFAPKEQKDAFWRMVANAVISRISREPLWLSTAGGGVAWLHVRIDTKPKYYGYPAYKKALP